MFDGILFDLDGTLWDAVPAITLTWNRVYQRNGLPPVSEAAMRGCMGLLMEDIAARQLPGLPPERQMDILRACMDEEDAYLNTHGTPLYPGGAETLAALALRTPLFVVSNCQDGYVQTFLKSTGTAERFEDFECAGRTGRPKSVNIALVAERNGLRSPVYIGDTQLDYTSAVAAGVPFLHAAYGFGTIDVPVPAVTAFDQIPAALERMSPT